MTDPSRTGPPPGEPPHAAPGASAHGATADAPPSHLRRSRRQKVVAGVCGGLGKHWDLDPVIFRVVLAVLAVSSGVGLIVYGFAWLLMPMEGEDENEARRLLSGRVEGTALTALLAALVGCGLFLSTLGGRNGGLTFTVMLSLAVVGSAYWSRQRRQAERDGGGPADAATAQAVADAPPETQAPPQPSSPSWWRDPLAKDGTGASTAGSSSGYLWGPADTASYEASAAGGYGGSGWTGAYPDPAAEAWRPPGTKPGRRPERAGRSIGGLTFLLALTVGAVAALLSPHHGSLPLSLQAGLACALVVFGLGLVLSAWLGRTGGGTVFMVVLTALLLTATAVLPRNITTDWALRTWAPADTGAVQRSYDLGAGRGRLDLSGLRLDEGQTVRTRAEVGAGLLRVTLPDGVRTRLRVDVGLGDIQLPGQRPDDIDLSPGQQRTVTLPAHGLKKGEEPRGTVELDLTVGLGQAEVGYALSPEDTPPAAPPVPTPPAAPTVSTPPTPTPAVHSEEAARDAA